MQKKPKLMKIRKTLIQKKTQHIEKRFPYIILFHCSGLTSQQWRQLKNLLYVIHGQTLFQPSVFSSTLHDSAGPTCILYLTDSEPPGTDTKWWPKLLQNVSYLESQKNLVLLYGQYQYTLVNHMDIKKSTTLEKVSISQQFFFFMLYPTHSLCGCLNQFTSVHFSQ
uniref:Ribosomal protein L10 n=1 Tax=Nitellopsis obtusa TaxID=40811 RepID=A0A8F6YEN3_9VIRI|nr:hypothetical protein [Nitellopsis obtusa]